LGWKQHEFNELPGEWRDARQPGLGDPRLQRGAELAGGRGNIGPAKG
jgi:hypothetical protein